MIKANSFDDVNKSMNCFIKPTVHNLNYSVIATLPLHIWASLNLIHDGLNQLREFQVAGEHCILTATRSRVNISNNVHKLHKVILLIGIIHLVSVLSIRH